MWSFGIPSLLRCSDTRSAGQEEEEYSSHLFQPPRADYDGSLPFWKWSKHMRCRELPYPRECFPQWTREGFEGFESAESPAWHNICKVNLMKECQYPLTLHGLEGPALPHIRGFDLACKCAMPHLFFRIMLSTRRHAWCAHGCHTCGTMAWETNTVHL